MGTTAIVRIKSDASGTQATMESPEQQGIVVPIKTLVRDGADVMFAIPAMTLQFAGKLSAAGDRIEGTMTQGAQGFPLTLVKKPN
jgi:hypothetical protein